MSKRASTKDKQRRLRALAIGKMMPARFTVWVDLEDRWLDHARRWRAYRDQNFCLCFDDEQAARDYFEACHILARDMGARVYGYRYRREEPNKLIGSLEPVDEEGNAILEKDQEHEKRSPPSGVAAAG